MTLTGGSHLEVREREGGGGMDWVGSVGLIGPIRRFWADLGLAEKKGKRRGTVGWVRKDGKERRFVCFVFLTRTPFE